jgi:hypothetical protein
MLLFVFTAVQLNGLTVGRGGGCCAGERLSPRYAGLGSIKSQFNLRRLNLMKVCSIFSQVLKLFLRGEFE